eukprot:jgi/Botrbrau1/10224/Bobra.0362s0014.1
MYHEEPGLLERGISVANKCCQLCSHLATSVGNLCTPVKQTLVNHVPRGGWIETHKHLVNPNHLHQELPRDVQHHLRCFEPLSLYFRRQLHFHILFANEKIIYTSGTRAGTSSGSATPLALSKAFIMGL